MTETVFLALITLVGITLFLLTAIILTKMLSNSVTAHVKLTTEHGAFELDLDNRDDK